MSKIIKKKDPAQSLSGQEKIMLRVLFGAAASTLTQDDVNFLAAVTAELMRARGKFPCSIISFAALVEEVGELGKAFISEADHRIHEEAVQVAVMALRCATEGDQSFAVYRNMTGLDKHD